MSDLNKSPQELQTEVEALRLKCDEAIAACASETCAMAQKLAASQSREQQLRRALEGISSKNHYSRELRRIALALPHDDTALLQAIEAEKLNPWKAAIIGANVTHWSLKKEHESNPRLALNDLLCISNQYALDPQISEDADRVCKGYGAKMLRNVIDPFFTKRDAEIINKLADELESTEDEIERARRQV